MRGVLLAAGFAVAVGATAGLAYLALRPLPDKDPTPQLAKVEPGSPAVAGPSAQPKPTIRAYETTATLADDLRDALVGDASNIDAEFWRVSQALGNSARWTLTKLASEEQESNPRVRALLVLAAGVRVQGEGLLLLSLQDHDPQVRRAAALAAGYAADGAKTRLLGVDVPIGRVPDERMQRALERVAQFDSDDAVRDTAKLVLAAGGKGASGPK